MRLIPAQYAVYSAMIEAGRDGLVPITRTNHMRRRVRMRPRTQSSGAGWGDPMPLATARTAEGQDARGLANRPYSLDAPSWPRRILPIGVDPGTVGSAVSALSPAAFASPSLRSSSAAAISSFRMEDDDPGTGRTPAMRLSGTQSVARALDILFAIGERPMMLPELAATVGLSTTTTYRIANALVERGLLSTSGRSGYALGERIGALGASLAEQRAGLARK
jgi:hypothetical protein